jgi:hypothetical protein
MAVPLGKTKHRGHRDKNTEDIEEGNGGETLDADLKARRYIPRENGLTTSRKKPKAIPQGLKPQFISKH